MSENNTDETYWVIGRQELGWIPLSKLNALARWGELFPDSKLRLRGDKVVRADSVPGISFPEGSVSDHASSAVSGPSTQGHTANPTLVCPICGKVISAIAKTCKHCGALRLKDGTWKEPRRYEGEQSKRAGNLLNRQMMIVLALNAAAAIAISLIICAVWIGSISDNNSSSVLDYTKSEILVPLGTTTTTVTQKENEAINAFNDQIYNLHVYKYVEKGELIILFDYSTSGTKKFGVWPRHYSGVPFFYSFLVRILDKNDMPLTHFTTSENFILDSELRRTKGNAYFDNVVKAVPLKEKGNVLIYPINVRDLDYARAIEFGFFMKK